MKTIIVVVILVLLCSAGVFYFAPQYFIPGSAVETVLIDKTDSFLVRPETADLMPPLRLQENKWKSIKFRVQTISGFNFNTILGLELPSAAPIISNPIERDKQIRDFTQKTSSVIDSINHLKNGLDNSSIYLTLITELNKMASFDDKQKIAIVYSDLFEHSSLFNIYTAQNRRLLKTNIKGVKEDFKKNMRPGNLHGIHVYFVYRPKSDADNATFALVANLFKSILEDAGATVYIGANLIENKIPHS